METEQSNPPEGGETTDDAGQSETDDTDTTNPTDTTALKKALDRERKARREASARLKELEPLAKQASAAEEATKTETQKLNEALNAEREGRTGAEMELLRYRTAADKGVPLNLVRFLTGANEEEIGESADLLLKELGQKTALPQRPKGAQQLSNGKPSLDNGASDDPMELIKTARAQRI